MEWIVFIILVVISIIIPIKSGYFELTAVSVVVTLFIWTMIGQLIMPEYTSIDKEVELYKLNNGNISTESYYELKVNEIYTEALLNTGKIQKSYTINSIQTEYINKPKLVFRSYSWDDNIFPYNLFITLNKSDDYILYIPNN